MSKPALEALKNFKSFLKDSQAKRSMARKSGLSKLSDPDCMLEPEEKSEGVFGEDDQDPEMDLDEDYDENDDVPSVVIALGAQKKKPGMKMPVGKKK